MVPRAPFAHGPRQHLRISIQLCRSWTRIFRWKHSNPRRQSSSRMFFVDGLNESTGQFGSMMFRRAVGNLERFSGNPGYIKVSMGTYAWLLEVVSGASISRYHQASHRMSRRCRRRHFLKQQYALVDAPRRGWHSGRRWCVREREVRAPASAVLTHHKSRFRWRVSNCLSKIRSKLRESRVGFGS